MSVTIAVVPFALGYQYGTYAVPTAINDQGEVIANNILYSAEAWNSGQTYPQTLPIYYAYGINDSGVAVGIVLSESSGWGYQLVSATKTGATTDLPSLDPAKATFSTDQLYAINDSGVIVGSSAAANGIGEAAMWQNGQVLALGTLPGGDAAKGFVLDSTATAINASGQIAGWSLNASHVAHAVTWINGSIQDLGALSATDSSDATGINDQGQIVGYDTLSSTGQTHAVLWQNGTMTDLGTLPGDAFSKALGINDAGIIVGLSGKSASDEHAVMWVDGKIVDLNTVDSLPWDLSTAVAINNEGEIIGIGNNGKETAYALSLNGTTAAIGVSVKTALQHGGRVAIVDSLSDVLGSLDSLQALVQNDQISSITLTDSGTPSFSLSPSELSKDAGVVSAFSGNFSVQIQGPVLAAQAAAAAPIAGHLAFPLSVSDTGGNVAANNYSLEILAAAGKLGTVYLTDAQPVISFSVGNVGADAPMLSHISGAYRLELQGSALDVQGALDLLQSSASAGHLGDIHLTDAGVGSLTLSSAQLAADSDVLGKLDAMVTLYINAANAATITGLPQDANVVVFSGQANDYTLTPTGDGSSFTVTGSSVSDKIGGVTALEFGTQTVIVASQTPAAPGGVSSAQVVDLYAAVLAREPDPAGLAYYEAQVTQNPQTAVTDLAKDFLQSGEYKAAHTYAQTPAGDAQFIADIYGNLLHRAPESEAVAWYQANVITPLLAGAVPGTAGYGTAELAAHAAVLADFSQSSEFLDTVAITAQHPADAQHWLLLI